MGGSVVFDLDGVIIDSGLAVRQAYLEAGVVCPDNIAELEGTGWLRARLGDDHIAYAIKNKAYVKYVLNPAMTPLLPPFATAVDLRAKNLVGTLHMMTGAPRGTIANLKTRLETWPFNGRTYDSCRTLEKMSLIQTGLCGPEGVYVDDQDKYVDLPDGWRFVKYDGQTADELTEEIVG